MSLLSSLLLFFLHHAATTEIYTLSYTTLFRSRCDQLGRDGDLSLGDGGVERCLAKLRLDAGLLGLQQPRANVDRKSTRLNSSHITISYAVFCLKKKKKNTITYKIQYILQYSQI